MPASSLSASSFRHGVHRGVQMFLREPKGSALILLTLLVLLLQMLMVSLLGVQGMVRQMVLRAGVELEVLESAGEADIQAFYAAAHALPYVVDIAYVPRAEALEQERGRDAELVAFLEQYKLENPFPDAFVVTIRSPSDYASFRTFIEEDRWRTVIDPSFLATVTDQERDVRRILATATLLTQVLLSFVLVTVLLLVLAVVEIASRGRDRRTEIELEHLLGVKPLAVLLPLVSRMTLWLLVATVLGTLALYLLLALLPFLTSGSAWADVWGAVGGKLWSVFPGLVLLEFLLLPVIAAIGSFASAKGTSVFASIRAGYW